MFEAQTMLPQNVFAFMNIKINMKINSLKIHYSTRCSLQVLCVKDTFKDGSGTLCYKLYNIVSLIIRLTRVLETDQTFCNVEIKLSWKRWLLWFSGWRIG